MLSACKLDASVLVSLDSIAWLLNIRASDVEFAPLAYAFGICWQDGEVDLFVDESKLSYAVLRPLGPGVRTFGYDEFYPTLENMTGRRIAVDRSDERREGTECASTCNSRWSPFNKQKITQTHKH